MERVPSCGAGEKRASDLFDHRPRARSCGYLSSIPETQFLAFFGFSLRVALSLDIPLSLSNKRFHFTTDFPAEDLCGSERIPLLSSFLCVCASRHSSIILPKYLATSFSWFLLTGRRAIRFPRVCIKRGNVIIHFQPEKNFPFFLFVVDLSDIMCGNPTFFSSAFHQSDIR